MRRLKAPTTNVIIDQPIDQPVSKASIKKLARLGSPAAMRKLIELVDHQNPFVASKCAIQVLDRAHGKVEQNLQVRGELQHGLSSDLLALAKELHRDGLIQTAPAPAVTDQSDVTEAEFEEVPPPEVKVGAAG